MDFDRHDAGEPQVELYEELAGEPRSSGFALRGAPPAREKRLKSAHRMTYEAEVKFLRETNGDLEAVRLKLGLSRRKICQLLLVDPSAWTRWTAEGGEAPPHIYRALDWYLAGMEKDPEYRRLAKRFAEWLSVEKDHEGRLASLEALLRETATPETKASETKPEPLWLKFLPPLIAFAGGALLVLVLRML